MNNGSNDPIQLVPLWEEMGASTGGIIGRFIGLNLLGGARLLSAMTNSLGFNQDYLQQAYQYQSDSNSTNNQFYITLQIQEEDEEKINKFILENNGSII